MEVYLLVFAIHHYFFAFFFSFVWDLELDNDLNRTEQNGMKVGGILLPVLIIVFVLSTFYVFVLLLLCLCFVFCVLLRRFRLFFFVFFCFNFSGWASCLIKMGGISSGWVTDVAKIGMSYDKFAVFRTLMF